MGTTADKLNKLKETKAAIKQALVDKGVADVSDVFSSYPAKIGEIQSGGGTSGDLDWTAIGYDKTPETIINDYNYSKEIYDTWDASQTNLSKKFSQNTKLVYMPLVDTSKATNMSNMFSSCYYLAFIPQLNTSQVTSMSGMFYNDTLTSIPQLDTSKVINMESMFTYCGSLTTIPLLDTSKVTNMTRLFERCSSLTSVPQLNTSQVTSMSQMFSECSSLTSVPQLDTSKVTNMFNMFYKCSSLTSVPQLDTSKVIDIRNMFSSCTSLATIPQLDTSKATAMYEMFDGCSKLRKIELIGFGTQQKLNITYMFYNTPLLGIDGDGVTGCKQALLDTFLTNSFDRATAGYEPLTITLSSATKAIFTEDELAQITAKGFTIA